MPTVINPQMIVRIGEASPIGSAVTSNVRKLLVHRGCASTCIALTWTPFINLVSDAIILIVDIGDVGYLRHLPPGLISISPFLIR